MANTLTGLIPVIYESLDVVSRELIGFIPAVSRDSSGERAALNESITIPITAPISLIDNTAAVTPPDAGDHNVGNTTMTISKSKAYPIRWNGEEQRGMLNAGTYAGVLQNQFSQAFRTITAAVETDLYNTVRQNASRAYGTAGTAPFGTAADLSDIAQTNKILDDNGAPMGDRQLVMGSAAVANLRGKQSLLLKVNEAGNDRLLRTGSIGDPLEGFDLHNSQAVSAVTKGTGASYTTDTAGYAVGATAITLITGTGTILAGDTITFAGDSNKYVVTTALTGGVVTIGAPGLQVAIGTSATAVTVGNTATANCAFSQSAIQLITRAPAMPMGPDGKPLDMAEDVMMVTDPVSGIVFEVAMYKQFRQLSYLVSLAWGQKGIKPNHTAILLG